MKYLWYAFLGLFSLGFLGLLAVVGVVIYTLSYYGSDLPEYKQLKNYQPPIVTRIYAGDGRLMAEFAQEKRVFVPIENMPDLVKNGFIAAEDQNFYEHTGVDFSAIVRAALTNMKNAGQGRRLIGASTITQQVAKNFLLTNEVSYERKIKEAILANRIEKALSKDQLLELYLNEIYLGARAYGVAAAALQYFNKSLEELSIEEIAYLAALPKAPNNYHPIKKHDAAMTRRNWVIGRMREDGYITKAQAEIAIAKPLTVIRRDEDRDVDAPYFAEEVRRQLASKYGEESLYQGGLAVRTTIDPKLQNFAENALRNGLIEYDHRHGYRGALKTHANASDWVIKLAEFEKPQSILNNWRVAIVLNASANSAEIGFEDSSKGSIALSGVKWARKSLSDGYALGPEIERVSQVLSIGDIIAVSQNKDKNYSLEQIPLIQGSIIALDPHTGRVLAMQGGWKYGISEFNRATQAARQPGSAFKPFVYLSALENNFTPATLILDAPFVIEDRPGHFWSPTNYSNEYYGATTLRKGVEKSRNLMTVRLADYLGMEKISDVAKRFGIDDNMQPMLSYSLGAGETTLLKLTSAYGELVNGGKKITPSFIDRIQGRRGETIFRHDDRECVNCGDRILWEGQKTPAPPDHGAQIVDPRHAYQMVSILEGVVERGTGVRLKELERPLAGKTGTTNESKDAWFVGFSPDLVVGVFMGFDEPKSMGKRETGSSVALPVFKSFMQDALKDEPLKPFLTPDGIRNVQINADTGARAQIGDSHVIWEAFVAGTEPTENMYILNGNGINLYNRRSTYERDEYSGDFNYDAPYSPGGYPDSANRYEDNYQATPKTPANNSGATNAGTGGLY